MEIGLAGEGGRGHGRFKVTLRMLSGAVFLQLGRRGSEVRFVVSGHVLSRRPGMRRNGEIAGIGVRGKGGELLVIRGPFDDREARGG